MNDSTSMTIHDLCDEANRLLEKFGLAGGSDPEDRRRQLISPRTVHFYVAHELLPRPDGRGPKARHPRESLLRILFIRRLRIQRPELSLEHVAGILPEIPPRTLERVALNEEDLVTPEIGTRAASRGAETSKAQRPAASERIERFRAGQTAELLVNGEVTPDQRRRIFQALAEIELILA